METTAERPVVDLDEPRRESTVVDRARARWSGMTGRMGLGLCFLGFVVIALAWNGAADLDYAQGQLPYLISGGFGGLGLVVVGAAFIIAESNRRDRAVLERKLDELIISFQRLGPAGNGSTGYAQAPDANMVMAGRSSYHDPSCHLVEGRGDAELLTRDEAESRGLARCRICSP